MGYQQGMYVPSDAWAGLGNSLQSLLFQMMMMKREDTKDAKRITREEAEYTRDRKDKATDLTNETNAFENRSRITKKIQQEIARETDPLVLKDGKFIPMSLANAQAQEERNIAIHTANMAVSEGQAHDKINKMLFGDSKEPSEFFNILAANIAQQHGKEYKTDPNSYNALDMFVNNEFGGGTSELETYLRDLDMDSTTTGEKKVADLWTELGYNAKDLNDDMLDSAGNSWLSHPAGGFVEPENNIGKFATELKGELKQLGITDPDRIGEYINLALKNHVNDTTSWGGKTFEGRDEALMSVLEGIVREKDEEAYNYIYGGEE
jgi:hypothetical protein